jgi:hypothetical protein
MAALGAGAGRRAGNALVLTSKLAFAANAVRRASHMSQPTSNPALAPKAARAYTYGPPVSWNRLATSAKHRMIRMATTAHAANAKRL